MQLVMHLSSLSVVFHARPTVPPFLAAHVHTATGKAFVTMPKMSSFPRLLCGLVSHLFPAVMIFKWKYPCSSHEGNMKAYLYAVHDPMSKNSVGPCDVIFASVPAPLSSMTALLRHVIFSPFFLLFCKCLSALVLMLLSAHVTRFSVSGMG